MKYVKKAQMTHDSTAATIVAPRVAIAEGACFRGSIDMQRKSEQQG